METITRLQPEFCFTPSRRIFWRVHHVIWNPVLVLEEMGELYRSKVSELHISGMTVEYERKIGIHHGGLKVKTITP